VLLSGGERAPDEEVLTRAEEAMAGGATGVIFGRNVWQRDHDEALRFVAGLRDVLSRHSLATD
jgi:class I fructose-bisphosphate aldolase